MGRWSQRTRCGGGVSINFMTAAVVDSSFETIVTFLSPITAAAFLNAYFSIDILDADVDSITQNTANSLLLHWDEDVTGASLLTYQAPLAGFLSPQTIGIT